MVCRLRVFAGFCDRVEGERGWYGSRGRVKVEASERTRTFFFLGGGELCFFFSGDLASLLQEFDWIGSSNRQQKIGSSPEKTKPLQVLATFRWNVLPSGLAFCLSGCAAGRCLSAHSPPYRGRSRGGARNKPTGLTGKLGVGGSLSATQAVLPTGGAID